MNAQTEPDSPNHNADLDDLNQEQLVSVAVALRQEIARARQHFDKEIGEMQLSCETLSQTIREQSETLENRAQVVADLTANNENFVALLKAQENENLVEPAHVGNVILADLIEALEQYGVNCARVAATESHNSVAVTFMQVANHIRTFETWQDAMDWLNGKVRTS